MITELKSRFTELETSLAALCNHLQNERPAHMFPLSKTEEKAHPDRINWITDLFSDLWYRDGQDGRETRSRHGIIMSTPRTLELATQVNLAKAGFTETARKIKSQSEAHWKEASATLPARSAVFRDLLGTSGLSRVHLKQCSRALPLLEQRPLSCRFTWYNNGRSITRISPQDAEALLLAIGEEKAHVQAQLNTLYQLPPGTRLARVQNLAPTVRANLVFPEQRKAMNCPLPLFVPAASPHEPLPEFKDVPLEPPEGRTRKSRGDYQLSDAPVLPSLRVHTYR